VVAVYSTFMQRSYDQTLHDVCIQGLPVLFALDRAGLVGEDGETHHGVFDLSYLRHIPGMSVIAPRDENMLQHAVLTGLERQAPVAVRYPRGRGTGTVLSEPALLPWGRGETLRQGKDVAILAVGSMAGAAMAAAEKLSGLGIEAAVIDPVFVKPLDNELILEAAGRTRFGLVTVEENVLAGGFGSAVLELLEQNGVNVAVRRLGIPDSFVEHGSRDLLLAEVGLTTDSIVDACLKATGSRRRLPWAQSGND
jgi:1-deoxy-D-xylulose-5-phosphate synthase